MSKYAEEQQYEDYLINKEYELLIKRKKMENPFLSENYNNKISDNKKNPLYKNVNFSQMRFNGFSTTGIKKKSNEGIKKNDKKEHRKKDDDPCLMITCNNKVCFC